LKAFPQTTVSKGLAILRLPLRPEDLIRRAKRSDGLVDFGDVSFRAGLETFLHACNDEAELSLFGYFGTRWDTSRFLRNLLRLRHEEEKAPEIVDEPVEQPLFVMGMPRSGTTFLHRLLTADRANRAPRVWEPIHPYPALNASGQQDRRQRRVSRQLRMFGVLSPEFKSMHPIDAAAPQECSEITAHTFASLRFDTTYFIPSYRRWLKDNGHLEAYRFHKRFLQHLQYQDRTRPRWVLKCPDHIFALDALQTVYPDALVVFVHRDPLHVITSNARLTEILRKPFTRRIDRTEIGWQEENNWVTATDLLIDIANREPFIKPIFHIQYLDLIGDPLRVLGNLYRHFGWVLESETVKRIIGILEETPNGGYGANRYSFDTYGFSRERLEQRFAPYVERFEIHAPPRERTVEFSKRPVAG